MWYGLIVDTYCSLVGWGGDMPRLAVVRGGDQICRVLSSLKLDQYHTLRTYILRYCIYLVHNRIIVSLHPKSNSN